MMNVLDHSLSSYGLYGDKMSDGYATPPWVLNVREEIGRSPAWEVSAPKGSEDVRLKVRQFAA